MASVTQGSSTTAVSLANGDSMTVLSNAWLLVPSGDAVTLEAGPLATSLTNLGNIWGGDHGVMVRSSEAQIVVKGTFETRLSGQRFAIGAEGAVDRLTISHSNGRILGGSEGLLDLSGLTGPVELTISNNAMMAADATTLMILGGTRIAKLTISNNDNLFAQSLHLGTGTAWFQNTGSVRIDEIDGRQSTGITVINKANWAGFYNLSMSTVWGSPFADKVVNGSSFYVQVFLGEGDDEFLVVGKGSGGPIDGGPGNDLLRGGVNRETLSGGADDDTLVGNAAPDRLAGDAGNDVIDGGDDADTLLGGPGDDLVRGRAGADRITGGPGHDVLTGGSDEDVFVYITLGDSLPDATRDMITDFEPGLDRIDLSSVLFDPELHDVRFTFRGTAPFTATSRPELRLQEVATGNTIVRIDVDGNGTTDMEINVAGVHGLTAGDFVL